METQVKVNWHDLKDAMKQLVKVKDSNYLSILENVLIEVKNNFMTISKTDLDNVLKFTIIAVASIDFTCIVDCKKLKGYLDKEKAERITFHYDSDNLSLTMLGKKRKYKMICFDYSEYPSRDKEEIDLTFASSLTLNNLKFLEPGMSKDATRYVLKSLCVTPQGEYIATDGRHLHKVSTNDTTGLDYFQCQANKSLLISDKAVKLLIGLIDDNGFDISESEKYITLSQYGWSLEVKKIDGLYPNWKQVIPSTFEHKVSMDDLTKKELTEFLAVSKSMDTDSVKLSFPEYDTMDIVSKDELSEIQETFQVTNGHEIKLEGDSLSLNHEYLTQGIKYMDTVEISINDRYKPIRMTCENLLVVLMPMRVN